MQIDSGEHEVQVRLRSPQDRRSVEQLHSVQWRLRLRGQMDAGPGRRSQGYRRRQSGWGCGLLGIESTPGLQ